MDLLDIIKTHFSDTPVGESRDDYKTLGHGATAGNKSKVKVFPSIKAAISKTSPGATWSTKEAGRIYVTSKAKWGKKSGQGGVDSGGKIAKGFTPGSATPSADFGSIKAHAKRTAAKYKSAGSKAKGGKEEKEDKE